MMNDKQRYLMDRLSRLREKLRSRASQSVKVPAWLGRTRRTVEKEDNRIGRLQAMARKRVEKKLSLAREIIVMCDPSLALKALKRLEREK